MFHTDTSQETEVPVCSGNEHNMENWQRDSTHRVKSTGSRFLPGSQTVTFDSNGYQYSTASGGRRNDNRRSNTHTFSSSGNHHPGMIASGRHDYQRPFPGRSEQFQAQSYPVSYSPANNFNARKHAAGAGASISPTEHQDAPGAMVAHLDHYGQSLPKSAMPESWRHNKPGEPSHSNGPQMNRRSSFEPAATGYKSNHHNRSGNIPMDSSYQSKKSFGSHRSRPHYSTSTYAQASPAGQEYVVSWGHSMHQVMPPPVYYPMPSYPTYLQAYETHGNIGTMHNTSGQYSPSTSSLSPTLRASESSASLNTILLPANDDIGSFGSQAPAMNRLQGQLEWYFSPQNLATDAYLASKMDKDKWVPIPIIAQFKKVKSMTDRMEDVVEALRRSTVVEVDSDGTMVRPILTNRPRTTLIIRELPDDTERQEIGAIFEEAECPAKSITKEVIGNLWFVEFETADQALKMLYHTRGRYLRSVPIAARLKSTILHTSRESYKPSSPQYPSVSPAIQASSVSASFSITLPAATPSSSSLAPPVLGAVDVPGILPKSDYSSKPEHSPPRSWSSESESIYDEPMHRMSAPYRRFPMDDETLSQDNRSSLYSQGYVAHGPYSHPGASPAFSRSVHPAPSTRTGYTSYMVAESQYSLPIATSDMPGYTAIAAVQGQVAEGHSILSHKTTGALRTPLAWLGYNGQVWVPTEYVSPVHVHDVSVNHSSQYQQELQSVEYCDYSLSGHSNHQSRGQRHAQRHESPVSLQRRVRQGQAGNNHSGPTTFNTPAIDANDKSGRRASKKKNKQTLNHQKPTQPGQQQQRPTQLHEVHDQRSLHPQTQKQFLQQHPPQELQSELSSGMPRSREAIGPSVDCEKPEQTHLLPEVNVIKTGPESFLTGETPNRASTSDRVSSRLSKPASPENRTQSTPKRNVEKGTKSKVNTSSSTPSGDDVSLRNESFPPLPAATSSASGLKNAGAEGTTSSMGWGPSKQIPPVNVLSADSSIGVDVSTLPALNKEQEVIQEVRSPPQLYHHQTTTQVGKSATELSRVDGPNLLEKTALAQKMIVNSTPPIFSYASVLKAQQREAAVEKLHIPEVQANNHSNQRPIADASASEAL
ncbi:hypothetical protein EMPS_04300 [Entomortierella parvispora]|uniref:HTH La-type RNA-binding domain-containing protein n=1 Tax=Entomortierella parvispora TaxID=205924 RepID=A0A9P3H8F4_9FUNG|nr:hypothetical protein EMPS_04300 [Entomortierella parvispora]